MAGPLVAQTHWHHATLVQNGSEASGNPLKRQQPGDELYLSDEENLGVKVNGDDIFMEEIDAFIEEPFKTRLDDAERNKKKAKLGIPDYKWLKPPQLDTFIASTVPKEVIKADTAAQKMHKLWLETTVPLTAIIKRVDAGDTYQAKAIQV